MRKRMLGLALMASLLMLVACGGGSSTLLNRLGGGNGEVVVLASDQPVCDVSSFQVTVTGITLTPQSTSSGSLASAPVSVLSSDQPVTVDLASLMDFSTLLALAEVPAGTYSQMTFTLSNPQVTSIDFTQSPPAPATIPVTLPALTVTYDINPPLTVTVNGTVGLQMDFDLRNSLEVDAQNNLTGNANLVGQASPVAPSSGTGFGEFQDLRGLVSSVSTTGSGSFTGSIVVKNPNFPQGGSLTVNLTSSTVLDGITGGVTALFPQTFVEADAYVDSSGNVVATRLTAEGQDQAGSQQGGFIGEVASVTRLGTGNVSQFTLVVSEEFPDVSSAVPLQSSVQVNVLGSTLFNIVAPEENTAQLSFDPTTLGLGQEVTVHGNYLAAQRGVPAVVNATSMYLRPQSVVGNFTSLLAAGQDGKTGGFVFTPCSGVFQKQTISVLTFSGTDFEGVTDLNGLTTTPTLLVQGQLFFEPTITSAGTVALSPPAIVLDAGKVHQLP